MLLFLAACGSGRDVDQPIAQDFKQGSGGVELTILPQYPPKQIIEGGAFTIGVEVSNRGAYDTTIGEVAVIGLNQVFNPLETDVVTLRPLKGRSLTSQDGEFLIEEFHGKNEFIPPGATEYRAKFLVLAEYDYQSILNTDVCINPAILRIEAEKENCQVQEKMSFGGQGAPVAVTSVEEIVGTRDSNAQARFTFTIENIGDGEVISPVRVDEVKVGTKRLQCKTGTRDNEIPADALEKKKAIVECVFTEPLRGAYTTTLSAVLTYTYRITENGEFTIRRIGG